MADFLGDDSVSARRYIQSGDIFARSVGCRLLAFEQSVEQVSIQAAVLNGFE